MNVTYRQLEFAEIRSIGRIDTSDTIDARYVCVSQPDGLGITLHREVVSPPVDNPSWEARELSTRYALWERNYREEGAVFFGAFRGDVLVGVSVVTQHCDKQTGELYALHVDKKHRREGIGSALLSKVEARCRAWLCDHLLVYTTFKANSVDFYRTKGFRVAGIQNPEVKTKNFDLTLVKELA